MALSLKSSQRVCFILLCIGISLNQAILGTFNFSWVCMAGNGTTGPDPRLDWGKTQQQNIVGAYSFAGLVFAIFSGWVIKKAGVR